jgi:hypothetical protein
MIRYEVWLDDARGNRLALLDRLVDLSWVRAVNQVGWFTVKLPGDFDRSLLGVDHLVEIWRGVDEGTLRLELVGFCRNFVYSEQGGVDVIQVGGPDSVDLLRRRIVAYAAGSAQAEKTADYADDLIKDVARENLGSSATDTARDLSSYGFTVAADLAAGATVSKSFAYRNVLDVCKDLATISQEAGTDLYFDVVPGYASSGTLTFELRTYTGQRGTDRTADGGNPLYFGRTWGNMANMVYQELYDNEVTYVYAGGQGEGDGRNIEQVYDTPRMTASVWNRCEDFADARNEETDAGVQAAGNRLLEDRKPRTLFSGDILDMPGSQYGLDWYFGDRVTCEYVGKQFDGAVNAITITLDGSGNETITARVEVD